MFNTAIWQQWGYSESQRKYPVVCLLRSHISVNLPHQQIRTYRETYCVQRGLNHCHFVTTQKIRITNRRRNFHTVVREGSG